MTAFFSSSAVVTWMVYATIVGALVSVSAAMGHATQQRSNRPVRWIWIAAIVLIVFIPGLAPFRMAVSSIAVRGIPIPTNVEALKVATSVRDDAWISRLGDAAKAPLELTLRATQRLLHEVPADIYRGLSVLLLAVSLAAMIGFALSYERTKKRVRRARSVNIDGSEVRVSPSIGPAVVGLVPSHIVVPEWLVSRPAQDQRIAVPLIGFNIGLEVGQIVIVAIILLLSYILVNKLMINRKWWVWSISIIALAWSAKLLIERLPVSS